MNKSLTFQGGAAELLRVLAILGAAVKRLCGRVQRLASAARLTSPTT